jgi:hypothetical protein
MMVMRAKIRIENLTAAALPLPLLPPKAQQSQGQF